MSTKTEQVSHEIARIQSGILSLFCGLFCGLGLFLMTVWLLVKGGPNVGQHLRLLDNFLIGYSVSWTGSVIGFFYGLLLGGIIGWSIGRIYNKVVRLRRA